MPWCAGLIGRAGSVWRTRKRCSRRTSRELRVSRELRRWQTAYLRGISPRSGFGAWLQGAASLTHVSGGTLFVHGGLEPTLALAGGRLSSVEALRRLNAQWWNVSLDAAAAVPHGATVEEAEAVEEAALARWPHLEEASSLVEYRGLHAPGVRGCGTTHQYPTESMRSLSRE